MVKKQVKGISLFATGLFVILLFAIITLAFLNTSVLAENLDLKVNGAINNYSSDVHLKVNSDSTNGTDNYDFSILSSGNPDNYAQFYSNVSGSSFAIDSWDGAPREFYLVYSMTNSQTGSISFSWAALTGDYDGTFMYYGSDGSYTTSLGSANMRTSSSYSTTVSGVSNVYAKIILFSYAAPVVSTTPETIPLGGGVITVKDLSEGSSVKIETKEFEIPSVVNSVKKREIKLTNPSNSTKNVEIKVTGLDKIIQLDQNNFSLAPGEEKIISFRIISPEDPGIYTGKIIVDGKEIPTSINVNSNELLFDAYVAIPEQFKILGSGEKLNAQMTLIPMGNNLSTDVTLNYIVKDFEGRTYFRESETIFINSQKSLKKEFSTQDLPPGEYIFGIEAVYPTGVATATSYFQVESKEKKNFVLPIEYLILVIIAVVILIVVVLIVVVIKIYKIEKHEMKRRKKRRS